MKRPIDILTITPEVYLREADELLERGDVVQASEKYYKAAEEAIKVLVLGLGIREAEILKEKGDLDLKELENAVYHIYEKLDDDKILDYWSSATAIITAKLTKDVILELKKDIERLVIIAKEYYPKIFA